ncbi:putative methyltransferase NSUN6 isoform X2 [Punica granatum]|uniref:Methyltransferase NSUN6 isoform X2 n=1 Tax=Punica granatum TaxID=22663 RepID=A0A6P8CKS5_PUNGR|nr:putative methyltransferase NSUN6 isoform X2 [Punica granatum]
MKKARGLVRAISSSSRSFSLNLQNPTKSPMDASERYCFNPVLKWNPQVEAYFVSAYGAEHFALISQALTRPSCYSCIRVNTLKSATDAVIDKLRALLGEKFHGLANGSSNSRRENGRDSGDHGGAVLGSSGDTVDPLKESLDSGLVSRCQIPGLEYVVLVRGSGPHNIDYGLNPDKPLKEVIVSRKCAESVLRGAQVYVPGVMACSAYVEKGDAVAVSVAVERPVPGGGWAIDVTRGTVLQGAQTDPYYLERSGLYIGQGTTMMSRSSIFRASEGVAVDMNNKVYGLPSFNNVLEGEIFLQNLPSIVTAHVLDPQKGERILDMCAAPGGKTTAIASIMKDEGEVVAVDRSHNKVLEIQKLATELGLNCITTYKLDALKAVCRRSDSDISSSSYCAEDTSNSAISNSNMMESHVENKSGSEIEGLSVAETCSGNASNGQGEGKVYVSRAEIRKSMRRMKNGPGRNQSTGGRVEKSNGFLPHSFDRVLLDAPCSALGLRPRLFSAEETVESLRNHAKYQQRMFDQAVQLVRPGGVIVYSTCTINPGENEALVRYALDTYKFLSLASQYPRVGGPGLVGHYEYPDGLVEEWLRPGEEELVQRFDPSAPLDTIGFFIAKFSVSAVS